MLGNASHPRRFPSEPLAIVGMACRLPGADDLDSFWKMLTEGGSGITEIPAHQMDRKVFVSSERGRRSKSYATISGLIPPRPDDPTSDFRSIQSQDLEWDPCHEILRGVVEEAIADARWKRDDLASTRTGTYVGHSSGSALGGEVILGSVMPQVADTLAQLPQFLQLPDVERHELLRGLVTGIQHQRPIRNENGPHLDANYAAQYVAESLQLDGPQMVIDAACASSLIALTLAGAALVQGEIDQAIVSSASYYKTDSMILFSQAQSCSATGSRPFDANADGLVNAEGYVVILIKTLDRALADGDQIHGVIRGIGLSSDGRGRSLWAPRKEGQLEAVRRAYGDHIDQRSVQYVEAHATSTQVGDATELEALAAHFQLGPSDNKIPLGSVKSNIGHTLESAGLASLIKCLLSMKAGLIPPTINLQSLNPTIDWDANPFRPVTELQPWPDTEGQPRRAAVNAFGIGGLNAHVILDGPLDSTPSHNSTARVQSTSTRRNPTPDTKTLTNDHAVAIVGRGVIAPGAFTMDSFRKLIHSGESQLRSPPADRWRDSPFSDTRPTIQRAFAQAKGGYLCGYQYDWRKHRIPPLQIELANPLQFMLLDAAQQALDESGYDHESFDRSRAAVIVGTLFGGEFSHQLQIGLRLHEILDELSRVLLRHGWSSDRIEATCRAAEDEIVKHCSAIRDQTGSFTCSTQASRIAKTLNVMGGAMAIDCGDCSGLAALQSSQQLLASRVADFVFCAAAQRDLDAPAFEAWNFRKLESAATTGPPPAPGEGVVVLLLRRLEDAIANGDKVYGIIRDVKATKYRGPLARRIENRTRQPAFPSSTRAVLRCPETSLLTQQFGHLQGASALLEILGLTVQIEDEPHRPLESVIRSMTEICEFQALMESPNAAQSLSTSIEESQLAYRNQTSPSVEVPSQESTDGAGSKTTRITNSFVRPEPRNSVDKRNIDTFMQNADVRIIRFWGHDELELRQKLAASTWIEEGAVTSFPEKAACRLSIVSSQADWKRKVQLAIEHLDQTKAAARVQEQGIFFCTQISTQTPRSAAMFPGQGSQHKGMLAEIFNTSFEARKCLEQADQALRRLGLPACSRWLSGDIALSEGDLRSTQLTMLTADVSAFAAAAEWGLQPDFLIGHSFGEYAALVAGGSLDIEAAIAITLTRADAVAGCAHGVGAMLSIAAPQRDVQALMTGQSELFISHANAPRQTVVAGSLQRVTEFSAVVKAAGIPAVTVPVGSPFHTPLLQAAQAELKAALKQHRWHPPRTPLLSSVTGRFVADRDVIIENLTRQLTQPIDWIELVERLYAEDVRVFIEVGPGRVLTKLTQQVLGDRSAFVVPMDEPSIAPHERRMRIEAALETIGIRANTAHVAQPRVTSERIVQSRPIPFDVVESVSPKDVFTESVAHEVAPVDQETLPEHVSGGSTPLIGEQSLAEFLIDVVVEQTGYPREVIELDWDLEADLGIDSIRKAQILGELNEYFDLTAAREQYNFNDLRSIRDILSMLQQLPTTGDWATSQVSVESLNEDSVAADREESPSAPSRGDIQNPNLTSASAEQCKPRPVFDRQFDDFLIEFVVERTGYPRDVIELDADLESDLGIDSIAKAQLIGEIRDHFQLTISEVSTRAALTEIRTLRQVRETFEAAAGEDLTPPDSPVLSTNGSANGHGFSTNGNGTGQHPNSNGISVADSTTNHFETVSPTLPTTSFSERAPGGNERVSFDRGRNWGTRHKAELQNRLFEFADRASTLVQESTGVADWNELNLDEDAQLRGIAEGANVHPLNVFTLHRFAKWPSLDSVPENDTYGHNGEPLSANDSDAREDKEDEVTVTRPASHTQRFRLEMSPAEIRTWSGAKPNFAGGAIVIGNHAECAELVRRLESFQVSVAWLRELGTREQAVSALEKIWQETPSPHLFIMSARDPQATPTLDEAAWKQRRETGITSLYWFCQKWFGLVEQGKLLDDACLFGMTALGGDFGISNQIVSPESGAITGLLKSILIESWVNGARSMPIRILDLPLSVASTNVADAICVELTVPTYDVEIGWSGEHRSILRSIPARFGNFSSAQLTPSGNWVVTGGARGITAYLVKALGARFPKIHFHLVGTAPTPTLTDEQRELAVSSPDRLRADSMRKSKKANRSPLKAWQELEKEIEIDRTLREFHEMGIRVTYHSCDVSDRSKLSSVLHTIRRDSGAIHGVVHGAGIGKDASFARKEASMVERCLAAKLDGALNLMALTREDPLQGFIAFGSISGRFGANGHTDYSLANDMLAKLVGWHRQSRPQVPSAVFHWHAWDDIGMATKPETRLALEMIGLKLMPAREGAEHFIREIEAGLPMTEVLITDDRYYRMFYPADRMLALPTADTVDGERSQEWPLVRKSTTNAQAAIVSEAVLDPVADPFLTEHRLRDRPLLPMVIMAELLAEGASLAHDGRRVTGMRDLEIASSIKFPTDSRCEVKIIATTDGLADSIAELRADFHSRNGKLVSASRLHAKAIVEFGSERREKTEERLDRSHFKDLQWKQAQYPAAGADFYVGGPLRCLRKLAIDPDRKCLWGRIDAPSLGELAGVQRDVVKWLTPSAVLDAALFATGVLTWNCVKPGVCLPRKLKHIEFVRLARPAESCLIRTQFVEAAEDHVVFDIVIWGSNDQPLLIIDKYVAAWLPSSF